MQPRRKMWSTFWIGACIAGLHWTVGAATNREATLTARAARQVDFSRDIYPILTNSCYECHGPQKQKGGLRLDQKAAGLKGGDSGPAVIPGKSADSLLISLVQGFDSDNVMPKKASKLTAKQIGLLRAWIDQDLPWDSNISFGRLPPGNMKPRDPAIPPGPVRLNPIDRFLQLYYKVQQYFYLWVGFGQYDGVFFLFNYQV